MLKLLKHIFHHPTLYSESDSETNEVNQLSSMGLIHHVCLEYSRGWHITQKGILFLQQSTQESLDV